MGKGEQTLFEKLETESEKTTQEEQSQEGVRYALYGRIVIAVVTVLLCTVFFPTGFGSNERLSVGAEWQHETLIAEYPFPVYKPQQEYTKELVAARDSVLPVFTDNGMLDKSEKILQSVTASFFGTNSEQLPTERTTALSSETIGRLMAFPPARREQLVRSICGTLLRFQRTVYARGVVNVQRSFIKTPAIIVRISPTVEQVLPTSQLMDSSLYRAQWERFVQEGFEGAEVNVVNDLLPKLLQTNLVYSYDYSEAAAVLAEKSVPRTTSIVRKGEIIVAKGEPLTEATMQKIRSSEYTRFLYNKGSYSITGLLGNFIHAAALYALFVIYLFIIRKKIYYDNAQLLGVSLPIVVIAFVSWLTTVVQSPLPLQYFIGIPVMSMLIAILFDSRTTFTATVTMALMMASVRGNDYETAIGALLAGTFAGYTVRDLRSRTQIFKSIGFIFLGYAAPTIAIGIKNATALPDVLSQLAFAAITAAFSPITTLGLLFVIERVLNITTDLRLLEYDNINHPLLTELNEKAPGTYQHTLMVARLSESAALAVEANPILVKVGAYFHDIGKMRKAEYFVENQINIANKHDRLPPTKSASIIRQHVAEGIELAKEYKLPQRIVDFIPMHHGTMLIRYFYVKALDDAGDQRERVDEEDFRYPGPKANSKETGILMLADAVESMSRTIDTNNREELEQAIDRIFEERLLDKQLDECDLTMRDLNLIKESFVKNLLGTGHQRVKYKPIPKEEDEPTPDEQT